MAILMGGNDGDVCLELTSTRDDGVEDICFCDDYGVNNDCSVGGDGIWYSGRHCVMIMVLIIVVVMVMMVSVVMVMMVSVVMVMMVFVVMVMMVSVVMVMTVSVVMVMMVFVVMVMMGWVT